MTTDRKVITNTDYLSEDEARRLVKRLEKYLKEYKNNSNPEEALSNLLFTESKLGKDKKVPPLIKYVETWIMKALCAWGKNESEYWPEYHVFSGNNMTYLYHHLPTIVENENEERYCKRDEIRQEILLILMRRLKNFTFNYDDNSSGYSKDNIPDSDSEMVVKFEEKHDKEQDINFCVEKYIAEKDNHQKLEDETVEQSLKAAYHQFLNYIKTTIENEVLSKIIDMDGYREIPSYEQKQNDTKDNDGDKYYQNRFVCGKNESSSKIQITQIDDYITHRRDNNEDTSTNIDYDVISENAFNTTEEELIAQEKREKLRAAVDRLPEKQKDAVEKYYFYNCGELTQKEIAERENISQQAVNDRLQNAYDFLRDELNKKWNKNSRQAS